MKMTDEIKTEFDFKLSKEIEYHHNGETIKGTFIKLYPPSSKQLKQCTALKQSFFQAMGEIEAQFSGKNPEEVQKVKDKDESISGDDVMSILYMSKVDMFKLLLHAKDLFLCRGVAKIEGEEKLTSPMVDEMSQDDLEKMTGEYLVNFILLSVLKDMK